MNSLRERLQVSSIVLFFIFLIGGLISSCHFFTPSMNMPSDNNMAAVLRIDSPNSAACCQMANGHSKFQNFIAEVVKIMLPANNNFVLNINFLLLFVGFLLIQKKIFSNYFYDIRRMLSSIYNYLLQAFSQGILQPQIYNA